MTGIPTPLINLTCNISNSFNPIGLNKEAEADINMWKIIIISFNSKSIFLSQYWYRVTSEEATLFTDAGSVGFAGVLENNWFASKWPEQLEDYQIAIQELFPTVLAMEVWTHLYTSQNCLIMKNGGHCK